LNHAIVYTASGNVITEACTRGDYTETATISAENATYTGEAIETAAVSYSAGWKGGELEISYAGNRNAGTAKATVTKNEATAEVTFEIAKATEYIITLGNLEQSVADQDHSVTATIAPADDTAVFSIEYTLQGEENWTTTAPTEVSEAGAKYDVRATLVSSDNIVANAQNVATGTLNIVPHNWDEGTVTIPAECDKPGEKTYHCTDANCDATKTEPIPMLGHSFTNYVSDNNATCKEDGTETAKCDRCDVTDTRTVVDSHLSVAHTLAYAAAGAVITESCTVCTNHTETATISAENATYTGEALKTATVSYSAGWKGGELEIAYADNVSAGTAKATVTIGEATAEITFTIAKAAAPQVVIPDSLTQLPNASDPVGQLPAADPTAVWETEYEVPLTQEEIDSGSFGQGVTTKWTTERPSGAGSYKVRTRLVSSDNYEVPVYTEQDPGWTEGNLTIRVAGGYYNTVPTNAEHQHNLSHVPAKEATEAAEGNIEYWYCASCDKYYTDADAKNETTKDKVILPKLGATEPEKVKFDDVKDSDWFNESVTYVAEKGLMTGTATTKFSPNANTTRAMLMTILARLAGVDTEGGANWYEKGLNWAKENGISDGTNPEANITREQLVTMLYRFAKSPAATGELKFADAANVSAWALDAMKWAVAHGIVTGMNANELNPTGLATRAQMAAILMRYAKLTGK
ncbi:MAG: S-layer homology domain-containing protein, partial [Oscillospiraceae bacterium]|nr:S-layer homology domain-containing protein [Oscillospiraceae bacterium]